MHKERRQVNDCDIGNPQPYLEHAERLLVTLCHQFADPNVVSQSRKPEVLDSLGGRSNAGSNGRVLVVVLRERRMGMSGSRRVGNNEARTSLLTSTPLVVSASVGFC